MQKLVQLVEVFSSNCAGNEWESIYYHQYWRKMAKTWANVERIFLEMGISYSLRDWFYLCQIEGRQFYYSPQTGKWRIKGKRVWHLSQTPLEFIRMAKEYSPPENKSNQTDEGQHSHQRKSSKKKSHKSKQKTRTNSSSNQQRRTFKDEIRSEFLEKFGSLLQQQRKHHYKIGWIWYSMLDQFVPTPREICWLCVVFKYSPWWAFHKIKNQYHYANRKQIFATIEENCDNWLNYFENRWGVKEDGHQKREQRSSRTNESAGYAFTYGSYLSLLRINFPFTKQELKSAYRKRALETHPDSGGTAEAFREVHRAYLVLSQFH